MKYLIFSVLALIGLSLSFLACSDDEADACVETTWYQDADGDGLGNPDVSEEACEQPEGYVSNDDDTEDCITSTWYEDVDDDGLGNPVVSVEACEQPEGYVANGDDDEDCIKSTWYEDADGDGLGNPDVSIEACEQPEGYIGNADDDYDVALHPAFAEFFSDNVTVYLDGGDVVIETNGLPNHTSPYWSNTTERCLTIQGGGPGGGGGTDEGVCTVSETTHPLYVDPTVAVPTQMAPGNIDDFNGSYTLRVPISPELAANSIATGLGAIGVAVSGSVIYNDEEGPDIPLLNAIPSLDYTAAHTGPQSYHYHLEPKAWSDDDDKLIGIMSDGFFLYGRRDYDGEYPTDLDESGGHFGPTPHNPDGEYHYHIQNELYLEEYYILFPDDFQGTPNGIQ